MAHNQSSVTRTHMVEGETTPAPTEAHTHTESHTQQMIIKHFKEINNKQI